MKCERIIEGLKDDDASSPSWNTMVTMSFPMCLFLSTLERGEGKELEAALLRPDDIKATLPPAGDEQICRQQTSILITSQLYLLSRIKLGFHDSTVKLN